MNKKQMLGICLIAASLLVFFITAAVNEFSTKHCWTVSCGVDRLLGFIGIVAVIVGAMLIFAKEKKRKHE